MVGAKRTNLPIPVQKSSPSLSVLEVLHLRILWPFYQFTVTTNSMSQIFFAMGSALVLFLAKHLVEKA